MYLSAGNAVPEAVTDAQKDALRRMGRDDDLDGPKKLSSKTYMMGFGGGQNPLMDQLQELEYTLRKDLKAMSIPLEPYETTPQALEARLNKPLVFIPEFDSLG